jgi:hypothetical protein
LEAADRAFERVMTGVSDRPNALPPDLQPADALRWVTDRVTEAVAGFAELPLHRLLDLDGPDRADLGPTVPAGEPVRLSAAPGSEAQARIWVHVVDPRPPTERAPASAPGRRLTFALTGLRGTGPDPLPAEGASFAPPYVDLPTAPGTATLLRYRVPADTNPGDYRGVVVGQGVEGATVVVTLEVT